MPVGTYRCEVCDNEQLFECAPDRSLPRNVRAGCRICTYQTDDGDMSNPVRRWFNYKQGSSVSGRPL